MYALERLLSNEEFFKTIEFLMNFNDSDQTKLQLSYLINSLEYILDKEGVQEDRLDLYMQNKVMIEPFLIEK